MPEKGGPWKKPTNFTPEKWVYMIILWGKKGGPRKIFPAKFFFSSGPPWQVFVNGPLARVGSHISECPPHPGSNSRENCKLNSFQTFQLILPVGFLWDLLWTASFPECPIGHCVTTYVQCWIQSKASMQYIFKIQNSSFTGFHFNSNSMYNTCV